ncbi:MAG: hypothetical protein EZS28_015724 [Streblomastix strix]|uniref:Uncharacterized protein n=1 Tax=Streblomastix strix TaxID=222440 RepID=A0A5J4W269_9EUKA|nr:MAG: hypothetical protein EZS28_015724 [Streblomastix strix]
MSTSWNEMQQQALSAAIRSSFCDGTSTLLGSETPQIIAASPLMQLVKPLPQGELPISSQQFSLRPQSAYLTQPYAQPLNYIAGLNSSNISFLEPRIQENKLIHSLILDSHFRQSPDVLYPYLGSCVDAIELDENQSYKTGFENEQYTITHIQDVNCFPRPMSMCWNPFIAEIIAVKQDGGIISASLSSSNNYSSSPIPSFDDYWLQQISLKGYPYIPVDHSYIKQGREYVSVHPHPWPIRCIDVGHNPRSILTTCGDCIYRADLRVNNPMSKIAVIHPDPCSTITQREHKQIYQKRKLQNGLIHKCQF